MSLLRRASPWLVLVLLTAGLLLAGPVHLPEHYHAFADQRSWAGIPRAADVLSNLGFMLAGVWALGVTRRLPAGPSRPGWLLFAAGVAAVTLGSSWYHLAPDDSRIAWDRLPIVLACAGLSGAVIAERLALSARAAGLLLVALAASAVFSVALIAWSGGDLRGYLLVQLVPLLALPMLQWSHRAPAAELRATSAAALLYLVAKLCELADAPLLDWFRLVSGHTLKHLFSALACAVLVAMLAARERGRAATRKLAPRPSPRRGPVH